MFSESWGREGVEVGKERRCNESKGGKFYVIVWFPKGREREPVAYMYKTLKREYFMDEETKECSQGQARSQCRKLLGNECKSQRQ